jgi:hypothetical protein
MRKILPSNKVYIGKSKLQNAGRGIFANRNIKKGEIIETCPTIEIPDHELSHIENSVVVTYIFFAGKNKEKIVLALGFGAIYNHSYSPNATYKVNLNSKTIGFIALANIQKDAEITFNYYHTSQKIKQHPLWFEV